MKGTPDKGLIIVRTWAEDWFAIVSISDTGVGIPEAIRRRIFEPFSTGGKLEYVTEIGKGTTFTVRLPLVAEESEAAVA